MRRLVLCLVVAVGLGVGGGAAPRGAGAQEALGWIAVQVYSCPAGMTAASLDPWACWLLYDSVEVGLDGGDGSFWIGSAGAIFDGWTFTWQYLPVGSAEYPIPYRVIQPTPPAGAVDVAVRYAPNEGDASTVWLSADAFGADLHVYNLFP